MTRRTWVAALDPFNDDDPAIKWTRDTIAEHERRRVKEALERMGAEKAPTEAVDVTPRPVVEPEPPPRNRLAELVGRVQSGDLSAIDVLRKLVDR